MIAGVNVIAADDDETAQRQLHLTRRARVRSLFRRGGQRLTDEEADEVLDSPQAMYVDQMMTYTAVGTPDVAKAFLDDFAALAGDRRADGDPPWRLDRAPIAIARVARQGRRPDADLPKPGGSAPASEWPQRSSSRNADVAAPAPHMPCTPAPGGVAAEQRKTPLMPVA